MSIVAICFHRYEFVSYFPPVRFGEFLLGMTAALDLREGHAVRMPISATVSVIALAALVARRLPQPEIDVVLALPFLLFLLAAASQDVQGSRGVLNHRWVVYAGEVSYCFYLVHELTIVNVVHLLAASDRACAVLALAVSCMAAIVLHHPVEVPCRQMVNRKLATRVLVRPIQ